MKTFLTTAAFVLALSPIGFAQTPPQAAVKAAPAPQRAAEASADPHVKFKDGERYLRDLSTGLNIPREEICRELGRYDCVSEAFRIVLGGVQAPDLAVNTPLEDAALTAPIALDRVALHVCLKRVQNDLADPKKAVLLRAGAAGTEAGAKPTPAWLAATTANIYSAILMRAPSASERAQMAAFYDQVQKGRKAGDPKITSDWVTLSCFAVASSLENTFY